MSERGREKGGESGTLIHPHPFLKPTKLRHTHRRAPHRLLQKAFNDAPFTSSLPKLFDWAPLLCKVKSTRPSLKRHYLARFAITGEKQLVKLNLYSASGNLLTCFDCHDWMGEGGQSRMRNLTSERESSALRRTRRTLTDGQCPASLAPVNLSLPRLNVGENLQALLKILTKAIYRTHLSLLLRTKITSDEFLASYFIVASITQ